MNEGVVKFFNGSRGFGFIRIADGTPDLFFHCSDIVGSDHLVEGERVRFDTASDVRTGKLKATNVTVI